VRTATLADVGAILGLLDEGYHRSKYREYTFDKVEARQLINGAVQRIGVKGEGGCCVFVWDDGGVRGTLIGVLDRIYHVAKEMMATDLFFYVSKDLTSPKAFRELVKSFEEWAWANPKVKKIDLGVTDIIGEPEKLGVFYKRIGYNQSGLLFEKFRQETF
jgi:hypothetical protein